MRRSLIAAGTVSLVLASAVQAVELYNNGPFVTGTAPGGNTISQIETGYDTFGLVAGGYSANPQRVADNFVISTGGWDLEKLTVYGYQGGGVTNPFTSAYVGVFDFDPTGVDNLFPRHGDIDPLSAPNSLLTQTPLSIFRVAAATPDDASRHIHAVEVDLSSIPVLPPGEYWFAVGLQGTAATSVVAVVPVTPTPTGGAANALSYGRIRHTPPGRENFWQYADGFIPTGGDPNAIEPYEHAFKLDGTAVTVNEWALTGGGVYGSSPSNWTQNTIPNSVDAVASFMGSATPGGGGVTVSSPITLGKINFNNVTTSYALGGAGPITLQGTAGASINSIAGQHTIGTPLVVAGDLSFFTGEASARIKIDSGIETTGRVVQRGRGESQAFHVRAAGLEMRDGSLRIALDGSFAGTSNVDRLAFDTLQGTPRAQLNITNNAFVVDYSAADPSPMPSIRSWIITGHNGGAWDGKGIRSENADASNFGIGYAEASSLTSIPSIFGAVDQDAVLFRHTRYGDANLDGTVNLADFNRLAGNFGSGDEWSEGDFTYDSAVTLADFNRLAGNFGLSASPNGPTAEDWSHLAAVVPEPGMAGLVAIGTLVLRRRRSR
jgi:hypothetical protein